MNESVITENHLIDTHCHAFHDELLFKNNKKIDGYFIPAVDFFDYQKNLESLKLLLSKSKFQLKPNSQSQILSKFQSLSLPSSNNLSSSQTLPYFQYLQDNSLFLAFLGIGIHPINAQKMDEISLIREELEKDKTIHNISFIGEIGLDKRYLANISLDIQKETLTNQLILALEFKKSINIHCVRMHSELIAILKTFYLDKSQEVNGVIHCFNASKEIANEYLKLGFKLGIGSELLKKENKKLRNLLKLTDLSSIVLETDFPYFKVKSCDLFELFKDEDLIPQNYTIIDFYKMLKDTLGLSFTLPSHLSLSLPLNQTIDNEELLNSNILLDFSSNLLPLLIILLSKIRHENPSTIEQIILENTLNLVKFV
ncbi:MAG: TatD family hydrolase [Succinivibrionaceae bacterium]|nr:TatD family hydrolase [Succinivibrionaceae bacterium]MEE1340151.1 TatD family hydrolase [Succinivibrionaceae bacterium]